MESNKQSNNASPEQQPLNETPSSPSQNQQSTNEQDPYNRIINNLLESAQTKEIEIREKLATPPKDFLGELYSSGYTPEPEKPLLSFANTSLIVLIVLGFIGVICILIRRIPTTEKAQNYASKPHLANRSNRSSKTTSSFDDLAAEALMTSQFDQHYKVLGLSPGASINDVKERCKQLLKEWHPDLHKHDVNKHGIALQKVKEFKTAYEAILANNGAGGSPQQQSQSVTHQKTQIQTEVRTTSIKPESTSSALFGTLRIIRGLLGLLMGMQILHITLVLARSSQMAGSSEVNIFLILKLGWLIVFGGAFFGLRTLINGLHTKKHGTPHPALVKTFAL